MKPQFSPSVSDPNGPGAGLRIVIADDLPEWRTQIRGILRSRPEWEVIGEASDGEQALWKTMELRPDVVVLDIGMPFMNGIQAGLRIRQHCPGTHIIFVTSTEDASVREAAIELGASGYVLKSNAAIELIAVIAAAMANGHNLKSVTSPLHK